MKLRLFCIYIFILLRYVGAQMVIESFEQIIDPVLEKSSLPTLVRNPHFINLVQVGLVGVGFASQLRGSKHLPHFVGFLLSPLITLDLIISAAFVTKK